MCVRVDLSGKLYTNYAKSTGNWPPADVAVGECFEVIISDHLKSELSTEPAAATLTKFRVLNGGLVECAEACLHKWLGCATLAKLSSGCTAYHASLHIRTHHAKVRLSALRVS